MSLRKVVQNAAKQAPKLDRTSVIHLYRAMIKELPRVLTIYDIDVPVREARAAVKYHFSKNKHLEDGNVIGILVSKGYMELEETLMQWKQKTHLMRLLDPLDHKLTDREQLSERQKLALGIDENSY